MVKFQEIWSHWGVSESAGPTDPTSAGIIVPRGPGSDKFNVVRLTDGQGLQVGPAGSPITVDEIKDRDRVISVPSVKGPLVLAVLPFTHRGDRLFKISGNVPGTNFWVEAKRPGGGLPLAKLTVAVLKPRPVKLSIRPIWVRGGPFRTAVVPHSKKPFDFKVMVDQMNAVWTPQANVVFTLVSSPAVNLTDDAGIAKRIGITSTDPDTISFPEIVNIRTYNEILNEYKDKNADLTMFLVKACSRGPVTSVEYGEGFTFPPDEISLISDKRTEIPELMAHEAGHFLGSYPGFIYWHSDEYLKDNAEDKDDTDKRLQLMHQGAPNYKIPFDLVIASGPGKPHFNPQ